MKIKMLKSTNCDGKAVAVGEVVDASEKDGRFLVSLKYAERHTSRKRKTKTAPVNRMDDGEIDTRDAS